MPLMPLRSLPHRRVLSLAWPMILSNLSIPLLGLVDTAILGHLPSAVYLSAVALGSSLIAIIYWSLGFLRMGTTSLVAQAYGHGNGEEVDRLLIRSLILAFSLGLVIVVLANPLLTFAIQWMKPSPEIAPLAVSYCQIRLYSAPLALANVVLMGWFIGQQNTRIPLIILLFVNVINLILDYGFVVLLGLNSDGAAIATVCADVVGLLLGLSFARKHFSLDGTTLLVTIRAPLHHYTKLLQANRYLFVRTLSILSVLAFFNAQGARMGGSTLAANAIIFQLLMITSYGLDGIAHAAEALVGEAFAQANRERLVALIVTSGLWSFLIAATLSICYALFGNALLRLFTDLTPVLTELHAHFIWIVLLPLACLWGFWLDGVFIGAGQFKAMQNTMLFCVLAVFFPLWWLTQAWGNQGLWGSFAVFSLARGLTLGWQLPILIKASIHNKS